MKRAALLSIAFFACCVTGGVSAQCVGDCGGDGQVTVDELLLMVNIALENVAVSECEAGDANDDGTITVDEIIAAVNNALAGCEIDVSGSWQQDRAAITSSTCAPDLTAIMQETIDEGDFDCTYQLEQDGESVAITETCGAEQVVVAGTVDATGRVTATVSAQENVDGCTLTIIDTKVVSVRTSPTLALDTAELRFSPGCGYASCVIVVQTRWTRLVARSSNGSRFLQRPGSSRP